MRTLHQSLAGTVILVLLGGLGGATAAQSNDLVTVEVAHTTAASSMSNAETDCPPGYAVVGGGFRFTDRNLDVVQSRPYGGTSPTGRDIPPEQEGWVVSVRSETGEASTLTVYARCMRTSGGGTTIDVAPTPDVTSPPAAAPPGALLFDDFSDETLAQWVGQGEGAHSGTVEDDWSGLGNTALRLTDVVAGGDMFSHPIEVTHQEYALCFEYRGTPVYPRLHGNGGAIGIAEGTPGEHRWLAGTDDVGGIEQALLVDDSSWHKVRVVFEPVIDGDAVSSFRIMLEDFDGDFDDVWFDNILLVPSDQEC